MVAFTGWRLIIYFLARQPAKNLVFRRVFQAPIINLQFGLKRNYCPCILRLLAFGCRQDREAAWIKYPIRIYVNFCTRQENAECPKPIQCLKPDLRLPLGRDQSRTCLPTPQMIGTVPCASLISFATCP